MFQTVDHNRIEAICAGQMEPWCVRRYRHEMQAGDPVFIWLGGSPQVRGIHGWGKLLSGPYNVPADRTYHADVQYTQRLTPFLPATALREHPVLAGLTIFHMPRATNFRLSDEEMQAIEEMIKERQSLILCILYILSTTLPIPMS
jgi:hypothetical protein